MEERVLDQQMAQFLVYKKRHEEAVEIYLADQDIIRALETLLDHEYLEGAKRGRDLLIEELWKLFPMQCEGTLPDLGAQLMELANKIDHSNKGKEVDLVDLFCDIWPYLFLASIV